MGGARNTEIKLEKRNSSILLGESKLVLCRVMTEKSNAEAGRGQKWEMGK